MFKAWLSGLLLFLLSGAVAAPPAQATVMIYMKTTELTEKATSVVQGTVERQQVVEIEGHLWTDSYVRVAETLKGNHAATGEILVLRQPGGETVIIGERVAGAAQFAIGEEVLVFARLVKGVHVPVGMCLGKFRVRRGQDGVARAVRDFHGVTFARFDPRGRFELHEPPATDELRLVDLKQVVLRAKQKGGAR